MENIEKAILQHQTQALLAIDENGIIKVMNHSFCKLFDLFISPEEFLGFSSKAIFNWIQTNAVLNGTYFGEIVESLKNNPLSNEQYKIELVSGKYVLIECSACICEGVTNGTIWSFTDISLLMQKESELIKSEGRYNRLMHHLNEVVFALDNDKNIVFVNEAWSKMLGYEISDSINKPILQFIEPEDQYKIEKEIDLIVQHKKMNSELLVSFSNIQGELKWIQVFLSITEFYTEISVWGTLTDITQQQLAENELKISIEKEKELNQIKTNFVNMVTHEFRTPIAGILSSVELLEMLNKEHANEFSITREQYFEKIKHQLTKMTELMNNVLLLGKIGAKKFEFNPSTIDLSKLCKEIILQDFQDSFTNNKIEIKVEGRKKSLQLDIRLIKHVIINLITNALKYSPKGIAPEVIISYESSCLYLKIKDYGIGIPSNEIDALFHAYFRASNTSNVEGTGLGLMIVKEFIELHNGTIEVCSTENAGTVFTIMLPYN